MLPEVGASELIVLAAVALIVVGPKDLPVLLRKVGQFVARMRGMAADFRSSFDEMARQSELDDLRKEVEALRNTRLTDTLGPLPTFEEINHGLQPSDSLAAQPYAAEEPTASILPPEPAPAPVAEVTEATAAPKPRKRRSAAEPAVDSETAAPKAAPKPRKRRSAAGD